MFLRILRFAAPPLASALLLWATFVPECQAAGLAMALVPVLVVARTGSPSRSFWSFLLFGFIFWFATLSWMPAIIANDGPWPLVLLGWVGLAFYCALYFALFGFLDSMLWSRRRMVVLLPFLEAFLWAGFEILRARLFTGFAWNCLGTGLVPIPRLLAPAAFGGVFLVSACIILANGIAATLLVNVFRREGSRAMRFCSTGLPLLALYMTYSFSPSLAMGGEYMPLRVALVQRNAPCIFSANASSGDALLAYTELASDIADSAPELVVLAESAFSEFGAIGGQNAILVANHLRETAGGATALIGGGDFMDPSRHLYNAAALYTAGGLSSLYFKQHLVPFGEYIPLDKTFTFLQAFSPLGISLHPGKAKVFDVPVRSGANVRLAPLICYEDTDSKLTRQAARLGAQGIVLITNDAWFAHSHEAEAHAQQAVLRAVETGLPVMRTGNSGITCIIEPSGQIAASCDPDTASALSDIVLLPKHPEPTIYTRLGDWPLAALFAFSVVLALLSRPARNALSDLRSPATSYA
ncbi:MAG: apolipoprotein N-acyltransferase [Kiritimatiellae bacterium]|nr:apolipoprotein N-acyltransferase [Kiritimatiellia bacterium]